MIGPWGARLSIGLAGLLLAATCSSALAATGGILNLPVPPKTNINGLALSLDSQWADGRGYRPVRVQVTCTPPAASDRALEIELSAAVWPSRPYLVVHTQLEIPAGSTAVSQVISVPQLSAMPYISLDVWENGRHLDGLSLENWSTGGGGAFSGWGSAEIPAILFVTAKPLDLTKLTFLAQDPNDRSFRFAAGTTTQALKTVINASQVDSFFEQAPAALVENWIDYTSLDVVVLSLADAESLAAMRPKAWQALAEWTLRRRQPVRLWRRRRLARPGLRRCAVAAPADDAPPDDEKRGWSDPDPETWNRRITQGSVPVAQQTMSADADRQPGDNAEADADEAAAPGAAEVPPLGADPNGAAANPADPQPADPQPADNGPPNKRNRRRAPSLPATWPFVWKDLQFGRVVALASDDPFAYPAAEWRWLVNTITPARWKWRFRHGLSLDLDNPSFDNFLIADVGLPPVRAYRVLISLFVILIGPVNYWYLRRHGRLHLLLFTVPAAALVATLALVGYAFIADGLELRCAPAA